MDKNRILKRMRKLASDGKDPIVEKFKAIPENKLEEIANKAVDSYITQEDWVNDAADSLSKPADEIEIEDVIDYCEEYIMDAIWTDVAELMGLNPAPNLWDDVDATIEKKIKDLTHSCGTSAGVSKCENLIADVAYEQRENEKIDRDPWKGTGMSNKDFI